MRLSPCVSIQHSSTHGSPSQPQPFRSGSFLHPQPLSPQKRTTRGSQAPPGSRPEILPRARLDRRDAFRHARRRDHPSRVLALSTAICLARPTAAARQRSAARAHAPVERCDGPDVGKKVISPCQLPACVLRSFPASQAPSPCSQGLSDESMHWCQGHAVADSVERPMLPAESACRSQHAVLACPQPRAAPAIGSMCQRTRASIAVWFPRRGGASRASSRWQHSSQLLEKGENLGVNLVFV